MCKSRHLTLFQMGDIEVKDLTYAVDVKLTVVEIKYLISCGVALTQNVPESALPMYCGFTKQQIIDFSLKMRNELDRLGLDM